jgi:hypothetical protein
MKVFKFSWRVIVFLIYVLKHFGIEPFKQAWADAVDQVPLKQLEEKHLKKS